MGQDIDINDVPSDFQEVVVEESKLSEIIGSKPKTETDVKKPDEKNPNPDEKPAEVVTDPENPDEKKPEDIKPEDNPDGKPKPVTLKPEDVKIEVDGKSYGYNDLVEAVKGNLRMQDYTKKTMDLADERKAVQNIVDFLNVLKDNKDVISTLQETVEDELGKDAAKAFEKIVNRELWDNPYESDLNTARARIDELEGEKQLDKEAKDLQKVNKLTDEQTSEVINFAIKKFEENGIALSLADAFKLMDYDNVQKSVKDAEQKAKDAAEKNNKKKPPVPTLSTKTQGPRKIENQENSFENISVDHFKNVLNKR